MGDSTEASESRDIALRWHSMLHLALFRTESSARSGARVRWFLAEREKAPARAGRKPAGSDASVDEALKLVAAGELSRAASRLTSSGLADACDPRILGQLRDKHLPRHGALPEVAHLDDAVDLNQKLGMLPRRSGTGPDLGGRPERRQRLGLRRAGRTSPTSISNADSQVRHASIMDAFNSDPELAAYARFRYAYYSRDAPIVIDERVADFASCEGAQQGDPASCANYAFATHACAVALDAELWRPAASPGSRYGTSITGKAPSRLGNTTALWLLVLSCLSTRADYWAQTMYMSASRSFLADFDTAITSAASDASGEAGPLILADNLARKRLRMPIRGGGGGLRLRVGVADAAFFGAGCVVLPTMVNRLVGRSTVAGFMNQLEPELGQGSFDEGASGQFAGLEAAAGSGCSTAVEMLAAWGSMIAAVVEEEDYEGLLAKPFADAGVDDEGTRVPKMQHRLTAELDKVESRPTSPSSRTSRSTISPTAPPRRRGTWPRGPG
ncbi:hypothetical protein AURANDRAFT_66202 [Aureococcus anophagefferens]|uniref:Uncharacterized protein n=1 Tax=Aureococcus anophagefferens TaxID=44056 RepID=F0YGQ8_AURAN|nr:hypothetical protein AURANDRAFT_66202 [Aureococcus anophagefferens]EGB05758.1 hypothetical protein AURANDRAFT_66202 [Aureococcus anophagefferens]|eukprot:XP_009039597.1 hypothetical protein AURANDRAFT_66202 [Aureococcus anophagefferens]